MKDITYRESIQLKNRIYIDVRSPGEFNHDHVPGAVNLPIFNDLERSEVGTIYRMAGRDEAVLKGSEIAGKRLKSMVEEILTHKDKNIILMCARGGMRSGAVSSLMEPLGIHTYRLIDGYKGYRHYISEELKHITIKPPLFVLQGLTGTGKTKIINSVNNAIDLEAMAGHRSSIFGGIGLEQFSQKHFETELYSKIRELEHEDHVLIEGESKKIGNLHLPPALYDIMRQAPMILITADINRRIEIILDDYSKDLDHEHIKHIVKSLSSKIGHKNVDALVACLKKDDLYTFTSILLEKYYDPLYSYTLKKADFIGQVENINTLESTEQIKKIIGTYIKNKFFK